MPSAGGTRKWDQNRSHRWNQVRKSVCYSEKQSKSRSSILSIDDLKSIGDSNKDLLDLEVDLGCFQGVGFVKKIVKFDIFKKKNSPKSSFGPVWTLCRVFWSAFHPQAGHGLTPKESFGAFRKVFGL